MEMDTKMVTFGGRVLPPEKVTVGGTEYCSQDANWNHREFEALLRDLKTLNTTESFQDIFFCYISGTGAMSMA